MNNATLTQDLLARPGGAEAGVLFPDQQKKFLVRPAQVTRESAGPSILPSVSQSGLNDILQREVIVPLPVMPPTRERITALQNWVGLVEFVGESSFVARISDEPILRIPSRKSNCLSTKRQEATVTS